jgi:hypothetical protein
MKMFAVEETTLTPKELAALARKEMVVLTRKGNPLVAVKSLSGADWESISLASNPKFIALIEASRKSYRERGGISLDEVRSQLGLKTKRKSPTSKRPAKKA